jgi:hypothetical protein
MNAGMSFLEQNSHGTGRPVARVLPGSPPLDCGNELPAPVPWKLPDVPPAIAALAPAPSVASAAPPVQASLPPEPVDAESESLPEHARVVSARRMSFGRLMLAIRDIASSSTLVMLSPWVQLG